MVSLVQKRKVAFVSLAVLISSPLLLMWMIHHRYDKEYLRIGMRVPTLLVSTLSGTAFSLTCCDKTNILVFFSVECSHCINELSNFDLLYHQFKKKINIVAISLSTSNKTKAFLTSRTYPFPVFQAVDDSSQDSMRIFDFPTILYVDEQRILRHHYIGERTIAQDKMLLSEFIHESFTEK
jgi:peroxiredoxin